MIPYLITAALEPERVEHSEICPDDTVYHYIESAAPNSNLTHVRFKIWRLTGDMVAIARHNHPASHVTPPFMTIAEPTLSVSIDLCNVDRGRPQYVGLHGGTECASYYVQAVHFGGDDCEELETIAVAPSQAVRLKPGVPSTGSCKLGAYAAKDYVFPYSKYFGTPQNIIFEVETIDDDRIDDTAIELRVYFGDVVPDDRDNTSCVSAKSVGGAHSCSFHYITVAQLLRREEDVTFSVAVRCGIFADTRFRVSAHTLEAELEVHRHISGGVCFSSWIFYHFTVDDRPHVRFVIAQYNGDLYRASVRLGNPPKFNSRNLMNVPDADLEPVTDHVLMHTFVLCDVPPGTKVFLGLFGGPSGCSEYDILPEAFSGACVAGATASARSRRR